MGGRNIPDNFLIAQEFMNDLNRASCRKSLMAVKLDMERAYDRMNFRFVIYSLLLFGFSGNWIRWVLGCIQGPSFAILVNGMASEFFQSSVGLCQGCPLSPYLSIICVDVLSRS